MDALPRNRAASANQLLLTDKGWATSTYQTQGQRCHGIVAAVDGNPKTAWVSAADTGVDQMLSFEFPQPVWVASLIIRNGYQSGDLQYYQNGRARRLEILFDGGYFESMPVEDDPGAQHLTLQRAYITRHVVLRIVQLTRGHGNVAITDLSFQGALADRRADAHAVEALDQLPEAPGYDDLKRSEAASAPRTSTHC